MSKQQAISCPIDNNNAFVVIPDPMLYTNPLYICSKCGRIYFSRDNNVNYVIIFNKRDIATDSNMRECTNLTQLDNVVSELEILHEVGNIRPKIKGFPNKREMEYIKEEHKRLKTKMEKLREKTYEYEFVKFDKTDLVIGDNIYKIYMRGVSAYNKYMR
jgi:hypothetical protein